ncbi:MAG: 3'-5' exonuclease [Prevotella sp.]
MQSFAAIDFETANGYRTSVCSVGVVIVENGELTDSYYHLIRPYPNYYYPHNIAIHGITARDTNQEPPFPEVWAEIAPKIRHLPLVAHNKAFDENCLKACFAAYDMEYPDYPFYCTLVASRRTFRNHEIPNHQLQTVASYFGFDLKNHHNALADAEACAVIALNIL